jgi:predicted nucleic acid-binding protein
MILADSSVWIDHIRSANHDLSALLANGEIIGHPFVTGEVALGSIANRSAIIVELNRLQQLPIATTPEVAALIESEMLWGRGIGYVDVHLLASCRLAPGTELWTRDVRLRAQAHRLRVATR